MVPGCAGVVMSLPVKEYFWFEELEERWAMPHRDLLYYAENGLIEVALRVTAEKPAKAVSYHEIEGDRHPPLID